MSITGPTWRNRWSERWARATAVFLNPRVVIILILGFSSGLPLALSGSTLALWMKDIGVNLGTIGLYALVGLPYTLKFLWAPVVDAFDVPVLGRLLGHRRGWLVLSQFLLIASILLLGSLDPLQAAGMVALAALMVAAASATQDIVIDAFRVESLDTDEQAAGMAYYVAAYRIGMLASGAGAVAIVDHLQKAGITRAMTWSYTYAAMAALVLVGVVASFAAKEPEEARRERESTALGEKEGNPFLRFFRTAFDAFSDFLSKKDALLILLFVVLFKLCDALAGTMTGPFVLAIGFDKLTYVWVVKGFGLGATIAGGLVGGLIARVLPLSRALWIGGVMQMLANFVFCWQAWVGVNAAALALTISVENFTSGIGTVIFVAYLSALCTSPAHTATQFALLTALASFGRTTLSSASGYVAQSTGWIVFFALTALAALPSLILLYCLQRRGDFAVLEHREGAEESGSAA